jgi:M6 family metalloprotease-like protein
MSVTLLPNLQWFRMSKPSTQYGFGSLSFALHRAFLQEAADLASASTDFSQTDALVVIANPDARSIPFGPAFVPNPGDGLTVQGRQILNGTNSGADLLSWGGANWLVHEIGHTLSLPDLYDSAPVNNDWHRHVGEFSQMGLISGRAPEWTGFERWQLGWLDDPQVVCMPPGADLAPLEPLIGTGTQKLLLIPVSTNRAIAVESRRARGYDQNLTQPGLLVSLIDTSRTTGNGPMRVLPEADTDFNKLSRTLTVGQSLTHLGITITFVSSIGEQELVRIQR